MKPSAILLTLGAAATVALAACSSTPGEPVETLPALNADIANAVADGVGEDVQVMRDLNFGLRTGLRFMGAPSAGPARWGCSYDAATGWHICEASVLPLGLTILRQYAFYDAASAPMETFDANKTAAIRVKRQLEGSVSRDVEGGSMTAEVHHDRDLTVSGLQGDEQKRTWNGTGQSQIARTRISDANGTRSYDITASVTISDVIVPHRNNQDLDPWPLSGTITKHVTGTATVNGETRSIDRTVTITFDGTQFPTATVNGESFTLDLAARKALRKGRP
jgi:hypothetical protein